MDELTREFLIESQDGLDRMERCLTDLEARPEDGALLGDIFRSVHTIKGTTGFLGFSRLEKLAHAGENLLGLLREGKLAAERPVITGLLQLLDGLRAILKSIEADGSEGHGDDSSLIERLIALQSAAQSKRNVHAHAGATAGMEPRREEAQLQIADFDPFSSAAFSGAVDGIAPIVNPAELQKSPALDVSATRGEGARVAGQGSAAESSLRVDVTVLNRMMNLVGELVLTRNQILQATAADPNMMLLSRRLDMVTADLRESVMKARMQPVSNIFSKMPRLVRDLTHALGRRARLEMEGQETELDKSLLEAIKDPLTHAVRNSLDHGIEPPDVRRAAGKDPEGTLRLRAVQEGSHVVIEVSDDGAGIAADKVRNKAIERGLITPEHAARLPERELLQLIFLAGFSTAAAVTNVSGRGVGMDVVRTNVEKIGGKVEIDSRAGKGTTLRLRIPLTLAIIPALIVRCLKQCFAVPQAALSELVHLSPEKATSAVEWIEDAPLYRLRGRLLPLVFLDSLLMPGRKCALDATRDNFIAVLDADGRRFGLVVDGLADPEEIVVKPLSPVLKDIGVYSGATMLGNAELALILDPASIAAKAGVAICADKESAEHSEEEAEEQQTARCEYLQVEVRGCHAAVPLADVLRIEQVPLSRIEFIGSRPVLNFDGELLPIEDAGAVLRAAATNVPPGQDIVKGTREGESAKESEVVIVVCRDGKHHVGIAVSQVLDVAVGGDLFEAGAAGRTGGVTLLKSRVTSVIDLGRTKPPLAADRNSIEERVR